LLDDLGDDLAAALQHLLLLTALPSCCAQVDVEDISKVYSLFVDVKRSTQFLIEYQEQYMFNEVPEMEQEQQQYQQQADKMEVSS
jgi:hypothetical protein